MAKVAHGLLHINPAPVIVVFLLGLGIRQVVQVLTSLRQPAKPQPTHIPFHATICHLRELGLEQALDRKLKRHLVLTQTFPMPPNPSETIR